MPLREKRNSSPVSVDPQTVVGKVIRRIVWTKFIIFLLRSVGIHDARWWNC